MLFNTIKELRKSKGITQIEFAEAMHVTQGTVSLWEAGKRFPDTEAMIEMAKFFGVTIDELMGLNPNRYDDVSEETSTRKGIKIPVLGKVQAGIPVEAVEDILGYEEITPELAETGEFFALRIRGESMEPRMLDGDVVIVRQQPDVESGDIAVVLVDGENATVKKIVKQKNGISLVAFNPVFEPIYYSNEDIESLPVIVLGKVVELRGKM